jgi:hypothetical protein
VICFFDQSTSAALSRDLFFLPITMCSMWTGSGPGSSPSPTSSSLSTVRVRTKTYTEAEFLDVILAKVLRVYLLAIHRHLY